jgi:ATP-dependent DNA helicase DinG
VLAADVVVANHRLLVEAAAATDGSVLPPLGNSVLLIDEAHNLPRIATDAWSRHHSLRATARWLDRQRECLARALEAAGQGPTAASALEDSLAALTQALRGLAEALDTKSLAQPYRRFRHGQLPPGLQRAGQAIMSAAASARDVSEAARAALIEAGRGRSVDVTALAAAGSRLEGILSTWQLVTAPDTIPVATWIEATQGDYRVSTCLIDSGAELRRALWQRAAGVVAASATLTQCGSFEAFLRDSGLEHCSDVSTLQLASPFDYAASATLVVPPMRNTPKNVAGHTDEVVRLLPGYLSDRGNLILCASRRQMLDIHSALPEDIRADVLMQDSMGRAALLAAHAERVQSGRRSVLLGLASMGEGVDLPGELCESVVIAKLTFAVPTHPVEQARAEWIEARGQSAFEHIALMGASVSLSQQVGRLLRTETDSGRVTVMDTRLATTPWGRRLLDGLPPFRRQLLAAAEAH